MRKLINKSSNILYKSSSNQVISSNYRYGFNMIDPSCSKSIVFAQNNSSLKILNRSLSNKADDTTTYVIRAPVIRFVH